ncbi:RNA polymerase sigma factor [Pedobacter sp. L105]|uniref:RNA polymerase sigma factor n=1 Tax=Pedobacter sp. L105 TaxID=1641871 RepID=UPI00131EC4DB|nr:sigma-70 family RNA polymerase sigma factor [Pedobacter sp. L105]
MASYTDFSDDELVKLLKCNDRAAYTEIYTRYATVLIIHAYNKIRNRDEARDVLHDVFAILWDKREVLEITTNLSGFLYTSVKNRLKNQLSREVVKDKYINYHLLHYNDKFEQADHLIRENQLKEQIEQGTLDMTPKTREAFLLSRYENLSHKEIAVILGIEESTVSRHISNALQILRLKLRFFLFLSLLL